ncbi:hypothetical protein [Microvirga arabica]|nr:hypothetical protein [Microvirga arabica]
MRIELDWRCWALGFYWDWDLIGVDLGPLDIHWRFPDKRFERLCRSATLARWVFRDKLEIRLDVDSNIWRVGYIMAAPWDHGLYLGPLNLQIEYGLVDKIEWRNRTWQRST